MLLILTGDSHDHYSSELFTITQVHLMSPHWSQCGNIYVCCFRQLHIFTFLSWCIITMKCNQPGFLNSEFLSCFKPRWEFCREYSVVIWRSLDNSKVAWQFIAVRLTNLLIGCRRHGHLATCSRYVTHICDIWSPSAGLEPPTTRLRVWCSTDWARTAVECIINPSIVGQ